MVLLLRILNGQNGQFLDAEVESNHVSIAQLKQQISDKILVPVAQLLLYFRSRLVTRDDVPLSSLPIAADASRSGYVFVAVKKDSDNQVFVLRYLSAHSKTAAEIKEEEEAHAAALADAAAAAAATTTTAPPPPEEPAPAESKTGRKSPAPRGGKKASVSGKKSPEPQRKTSSRTPEPPTAAATTTATATAVTLVENPSLSVFPLTIAPADTVNDIRKRIKATLRLRRDQQQLVYAGDMLDDNLQTVQQLGISQQNLMYLRTRSPPPLGTVLPPESDDEKEAAPEAAPEKRPTTTKATSKKK